eukprot:13216580-Alexandrium_andersonii.AAC.1
MPSAKQSRAGTCEDNPAKVRLRIATANVLTLHAGPRPRGQRAPRGPHLEPNAGRLLTLLKGCLLYTSPSPRD